MWMTDRCASSAHQMVAGQEPFVVNAGVCCLHKWLLRMVIMLEV